MKKKSFLVALLSVIVVGAVAIGGIVAYFTATSDTVQNTFTMGSVDILLREIKTAKFTVENQNVWDNLTDEEGNFIYTYSGNTYDEIYPGAILPKWAEIVVDGSSEDCFLRMKITIDKWSSVNELVKFGENDDGKYLYSDCINIDNNWTFQKYEVNTEADTCSVYMTYNSPVLKDEEARTDKVIPAPFNDLYIPSGLTSEEAETLDGFNISFEAHAIQAMTFKNAEEAWTAFDAE